MTNECVGLNCHDHHNLQFTHSVATMLSLAKPLAECNIDGHYKIGQSLKTNISRRCPYAHGVYMSDGKHPQWVFFVVCDAVEAMPPVKTFLLNATLSGSSYALNEGGKFDKQSFVVHWRRRT